ncbi:MAG: HAD family hydrolase [Acidobacteriota bacterium]
MSLRAVIFDYGMVLTGPPAPEAWSAMQRITGLSDEELHSAYWSFRHAYDEGKLSGVQFWRRLAGEAGLRLTEIEIYALNDWDARMWTVENHAMLAWQQQVKQRGLRTAILSNMGDNVHARMERIFNWLGRFDVLVWSYRLGVAKPDEAIYQHTLKELDVAPEQALFIDDKRPNIEAAQKLGLRAHLFTTADRLRDDLIAHGLDAELPLP